MNERILIVDDNLEIRKGLMLILEQNNYFVYSVETGEEALEDIKENNYDVIILDVRLPGKSGMELMPDIRHIRPDIPIIVITGMSTVNEAVKAIKLGAFGYLSKPFRAKDILITVEKALKWRSVLQENISLKDQIMDKYRYNGIFGKSKKIKEVIDTIKQISDTDVNVLITGESGTGKELVARAIHYSGNRKNAPFVPINCSSLPDNLLESELFGYQKGAFTGAYRNKDGLFKIANKGTIFLHEIGDMPLSLQAKILKVLDSGEFLPLGATKTLKTDARIICATNVDLNQAILEGKFREDLYFRINVVNIHIPPLRDRREDVNLLIDHFIEKFSMKLNKKIKGISESARDILIRYSWPGNVRELENVLESACVLSKNEIIDVDLFLTDEKTEEIPYEWGLVEVKPEFIGGEAALFKWIKNNIRYPVLAKKNGIEGKVYIEFVVDKKGNVTNVKVKQGTDWLLDKEALRVIRLLPQWKPGMQAGKPVSVHYIIPVKFVLGG